MKIAAVPCLSTALRCLAHARQLDRNPFACVISGSSRTADIEKILVQGAHGPRRLVVILQTGSQDSPFVRPRITLDTVVYLPGPDFCGPEDA